MKLAAWSRRSFPHAPLVRMRYFLLGLYRALRSTALAVRCSAPPPLSLFFFGTRDRAPSRSEFSFPWKMVFFFRLYSTAYLSFSLLYFRSAYRARHRDNSPSAGTLDCDFFFARPGFGNSEPVTVPFPASLRTFCQVKSRDPRSPPAHRFQCFPFMCIQSSAPFAFLSRGYTPDIQYPLYYSPIRLGNTRRRFSPFSLNSFECPGWLPHLVRIMRFFPTPPVPFRCAIPISFPLLLASLCLGRV